MRSFTLPLHLTGTGQTHPHDCMPPLLYAGLNRKKKKKKKKKKKSAVKPRLLKKKKTHKKKKKKQYLDE
eukprot:NODE_11023_length_1313_cov_2.048061.p4 GENE.NODE_11023_length_1313_cov_2.048061~~NODE_11023_length_1313_cov_2.048061.p4  ORF type:complete len:69 (-),score=34.38 NODE_11023_length_1313_cov_2.048061:96-302(-)